MRRMEKMSSVADFKQCEQCGFPGAAHLYYCRSAEWRLDCPRCGYHEDWKHQSYFSSGHLEKGIRTVIYSAGAYSAQSPKTGIRECGGVSEAELQELAARVREDIASGKLSPESYVTEYNFQTGEVTALVGQIPIPHPDDDTGAD
jgi:hypothetical protein